MTRLHLELGADRQVLARPQADPLAKTVGPATTAVSDHRSSFRCWDSGRSTRYDRMYPMIGIPTRALVADCASGLPLAGPGQDGENPRRGTGHSDT